MTDQEKNTGKESESLVEAVAETISEIVETVVETVATVAETAVETIAQLAEPENKSETTIEQPEEKRIGYAAATTLPQIEDTEEEAAVEPDDKAGVEAAIARARGTHGETEEEIRDPLVAETLPELPRQNRARLQIQSTNRIHLYWSLSGNPFSTLHKALGSRAANYQLVTRLVNLQTNVESFALADVQGDFWFNVRSNSSYRADVGFYAPNRPFVRLLSSNTIETPRSAPSMRVATEDDWIVSTREFVQVLTASGYSHDVFQVAFGAVDPHTGEVSDEDATLAIANRFAPVSAAAAAQNDLNLGELRWFLVSIASGAEFADLQNLISPELNDWLETVLEANPNALQAENVRDVLESIFGSEFTEVFTGTFGWERLAPVAVGASAIHFPEVLFPRLRLPDLRKADNPFAGEDFGIPTVETGLFPISSAEFLFPTSPVFRED